jgi:tetratricopeptide (TPR) repeat protein
LVIGLLSFLLSLQKARTIRAAQTETAAEDAKLGKVDFPTSGSGPAQAHFLRGVAALHSFWYEEALDEFRQSTQADPDFMMGYWGEAMAHNHPIWHEQDTDAARAVLKKIRDTEKLTPRERAYLNALRVLYGDGDKLARDMAYSAVMEKIYRDYSDDLEAASFYALSLLGTVRPGDKGFRRQMQAGAIARQVYDKNPNHPGAAHYIIHAFDDPEHAILALPAARRYAEIAPAAHHARHMPSHIFLQLGMWPEAAASNESAWAVSDAWVKRKKLAIRQRDYHSLHWLLYVYLQQGRYAKADDVLASMCQAMTESGDDTRMARTYSSMAAALVVETEQWHLVPKLFRASGASVKGQPSGSLVASEDSGGAHCAVPKYAAGKTQDTSGGKTTNKYQARTQNLPVFMRGLAAAMKGSAEVKRSLAELRVARKQLVDAGETYRAKHVEIMELEVAAAASAVKGNYKEAIEQARRAATLEEEMSPPSGPPDTIKPVHELYGEILLRAGRPKEAAQPFATALLRQPNRARALLGAARAAAQSGDRRAAETAYSNLLRIWDHADNQLPERREAQAYFEHASAR